MKFIFNEDTVKNRKGKWVNKGDTGETHGEFKTKKEADAQRKAMFARGYKAESISNRYFALVQNDRGHKRIVDVTTAGEFDEAEDKLVPAWDTDIKYEVREISKYDYDKYKIFTDEKGFYNINEAYQKGTRVRLNKGAWHEDQNKIGTIKGNIGETYWVEWDDGSTTKEIKGYLDIVEPEEAVFTKNKYDGKTYFHGFMDRKEADRHFPDRLKFEKLNNRERKVYIDAINNAEDMEELKDIVHEIFFYDKALFVKLRNFPKNRSFEEQKQYVLNILADSLNESLNEDHRDGYTRLIKLDPATISVVDEILGQLSDGYWENSPTMEKYWRFALVNGDSLSIYKDSYNYDRYRNKPIFNGFYKMTDDEIKKFFANKIKFIVKAELKDNGDDPVKNWRRDSDYDLDYINGTISDAYRAYDILMGRHIPDSKYSAAKNNSNNSFSEAFSNKESYKRKLLKENSSIRVFSSSDDEFKNLSRLAEILTELSPNGYHYYVGDTYFDYGQDWRWTTVLCDNGGRWGGYQALNPREQEEAILAINDKELKKIAEDVLTDKYCPDKGYTRDYEYIGDLTENNRLSLNEDDDGITDHTYEFECIITGKDENGKPLSPIRTTEVEDAPNMQAAEKLVKASYNNSKVQIIKRKQID